MVNSAKSQNNNDKISIIVPVYNVEKYLARCLDSIIDQTYTNIEIILVDDGSLDESGKICDEYAKKDKRIKVIHKQNGGLSSARNSGIEMASGKYVCFIDSDDYIEKDMIEYLYKGVKKYHADIVVCGLSNIYSNGKIECATIPREDIIYNRKQALDIHLLTGYIDHVICDKIYKKELFNDIKFPEGKIYEDMMTTYKLIDKVDKVVLRPDSKYNYCRRSDSISEKRYSKNTLVLLEVCDQAVSFVLKKYPDLQNVKIAQIHWYIVLMNKMILARETNDDLVKTIKRKIKLNKRKIIMTPYLTKMRKTQMLLFYYCFPLYKVLYCSYVRKNR